MARKVDEDDDMENGRGSPEGVRVPDLGQVPSRYIYLVKRDGNLVSGGVRVDNGENTMRESESGVIERLQTENMTLMRDMAEMREEMRKMNEKVGALEMSQSVLISHHNAHTALLERHRKLLTTLTSQPPTPSDRWTPFEEDTLTRLGMPPSRFSSAPPPGNATKELLIPPPFPSPNPMSPLATPRTTRMFNEFIHPGMLQLNKLHISSSPRYVHGDHTGPDIPMEDLPMVGPSDEAEAAVEGGGETMSSWRFTLEAAPDVTSEKVESGEPGPSGLVQEEKDNLPGIPMSQRMMFSPASQTETDEVDAGESSAMSVDQPDKGLHWNTVV
jgi:hypothetical protein